MAWFGVSAAEKSLHRPSVPVHFPHRVRHCVSLVLRKVVEQDQRHLIVAPVIQPGRTRGFMVRDAPRDQDPALALNLSRVGPPT